MATPEWQLWFDVHG